MMVLLRALPAVVALAWPVCPAWAQTPPSPGDTPELREARERWRELNERVGGFPRGHADLLQWERKNLAPDAVPGPAGDTLTADEAVRRALASRPDLSRPAANPAAVRELHLAGLALVTQVRQAWFDAVLAGQALALQQSRSAVAGHGAELGQRMVQAGNWSQARLQREQLTLAREQIALLQARQAERSARERLVRALGPVRADDIAGLARRLPDALPEPPKTVDSLTIEGAEARVLQARSTPGAEAEAEIRSLAREAWGRVLDQHALAQQTQDVLLPLQIAQEQETQQRYNGMLQSTWELLEATRERLGATSEAAQARHAYWTALLDWQLLLAGGPYRASDTNALPAAAGDANKEH